MNNSSNNLIEQAHFVKQKSSNDIEKYGHEQKLIRDEASREEIYFNKSKTLKLTNVEDKPKEEESKNNTDEFQIAQVQEPKYLQLLPEAQVVQKPQAVKAGQENINIRAAIIHLFGDMVQSIGVVIAALIIYFKPEYHIADPICTFIFAILVLLTTVPIFKDCISILMETSPKQIDINECFTDMISSPYVDSVHDFHVWALSAGTLAMSAHVRSK